MLIVFREKARGTEKHGQVAWLPAMCALTGDQTHNPFFLVGGGGRCMGRHSK